jgi:hypothetical protein
VASAPGIKTAIVSMRDERFVRETVAAFEEPLAREILEELQTPASRDKRLLRVGLIGIANSRRGHFRERAGGLRRSLRCGGHTSAISERR